MLERAYDYRLYFPRGPRPPAHKCIGHLLPNGGTALPPHHNNSHPPSLCNLSSPSPIEMTKSRSLYLLLLLCVRAPPSVVPPLLWGQMSLPVYVTLGALPLCSPR